MRFETLRDPLWDNIRVDELTLELVDTEVFQRLRYVRQLGLAYLVYPGATHSRFEHALGAYHLARSTLMLLAETDSSYAISDTEQRIALARAYFNEIATGYNICLEVVPDRFLASVAGLKPQPLFAAADFERAAVTVDLEP